MIFCLSLNEYFVNYKLLKIGLFMAYYSNIHFFVRATNEEFWASKLQYQIDSNNSTYSGFVCLDVILDTGTCKQPLSAKVPCMQESSKTIDPSKDQNFVTRSLPTNFLLYYLLWCWCIRSPCAWHVEDHVI